MIKLVKASAELIEQHDNVSHVAKCARVCYGKEFGNDENTVKGLIKRNHTSMFRHETVYAIINKSRYTGIGDILKYYKECPYINIYDNSREHIYIVTNGQFMLDLKINNNNLYNILTETRVDNEIAEQNSIFIEQDMIRVTVKVKTQIAITRELNRVSPNNIAERSTRYCTEEGEVVVPVCWEDVVDMDEKDYPNDFKVIYDTTKNTFNRYNALVYEYNIKPEQARIILPLWTASIAVYTYTLKEWQNIINLRFNNSTGKAHDDAKNIIGKVKELIENKFNYKFK